VKDKESQSQSGAASSAYFGVPLGRWRHASGAATWLMGHMITDHACFHDESQPHMSSNVQPSRQTLCLESQSGDVEKSKRISF
jgi:hypothetical protein